MDRSSMLFDAYVFVDWSAGTGLSPATPKPDTVWIGEFTRDGAISRETYCRTREVATQQVLTTLRGHVAEARRVLVGFDFPYGYPIGLATTLGADNSSPAWRYIWDLLASRVIDTPENVSNRFVVADWLNQQLVPGTPGPFWGVPWNTRSIQTSHLLPTKPQFPYRISDDRLLPEFRLTELALRQRGLQVQEVWKLVGNGSVGSQAMVGIPRVQWLRFHPLLASVSRVWPFETGFTVNPVSTRGPLVLHAEIWPGIVSRDEIVREQSETNAIKDQAQVRRMCRWAADLDAVGCLGAHFDRPHGLSSVEIEQAVNEEGWILGT